MNDMKKTDRREEFICKAEKIKPKLRSTLVKPFGRIPTTPLREGDSVVFDFGNHHVGYLNFHLITTGSHPDAPALLKIKFCENKRELEEDSADYHGWISRGWIQEEWIHVDVFPAEVRLPRRYAFRYVKIEILAASQKYALIIDQLEAESVTSAGEVSFSTKVSLTEEEQNIDRVAIRTLRNCMQDVFEDGPKRDRRLWIGDLRLQALANYASFRQNDLVKRCLYLFAGTADESGRVPSCLFIEPKIEGDDTYMFDYSLFFIDVLLNYYLQTKDEETLLDLYEVAKTQFLLSADYFDGDVIRDSDVLGWCFLDWNLNLNKQAGAQAIYIYSAKALLKLQKLVRSIREELVSEEEMSSLQQEMERKVQSARREFFDEEKGLFVSGENRQISYAANAWSVLAGIWDAEKNRKILKNLTETEEAEPMVTPYMYHHLVEAFLSCGEKKAAYEWMMSYWGGMVKDGADTFYELYNPHNPFESPYGSSIVNSYCHAWSCTPTYFMHMCGLTKEKME